MEIKGNNEVPPSKEDIVNTSKELYADLRQEGINPLDNDKFFDFLESLPDESRDKLIGKSVFPDDRMQMAEEIGEKYTQCLVHPGVSARKEEFTDYVKKLKTEDPFLTPKDALKQFSNYLGEKTLYRGMALTEEEFNHISEEGILAPAMVEPQNAETSLSVLLDPSISRYDRTVSQPKSFVDDIKYRIADTGQNLQGSSISFSTSEYPEVAASVGWHTSGRNLEDPNLGMYIFELKVPAILTYNESQMMGDMRGPTEVGIQDKSYKGENLEVFIPLGVSKKDITQVQQIEPPPVWRRIK